MDKNIALLVQHLACDPHLGDQVVHTVQGFEEGGFPAAGGTDQGGDALFRDLHINIFQCLGLAVPQA